MEGVLVFRTLPAALAAGFTVHDRLWDRDGRAIGYIVRQRIGDRWQLAHVVFGA